MYLKNSKIKDFVKSEIVCKLEDFSIDNNYNYECTQVYACDLAYKLFENENIDGSFFYDTIQAKKWLSEHFDDLSEIIEELQFQFDEDFCNKILLDFFKNPDCFIVVVVLEVANYLLGQCKYINENWNNDITLTNDIIDIICQQLDEL